MPFALPTPGAHLPACSLSPKLLLPRNAATIRYDSSPCWHYAVHRISCLCCVWKVASRTFLFRLVSITSSLPLLLVVFLGCTSKLLYITPAKAAAEILGSEATTNVRTFECCASGGYGGYLSDCVVGAAWLAEGGSEAGG